jgi:predicted DNA-binding mobile mystery protein A
MKTSLQLRQMDLAADAAKRIANLAPTMPGGWLSSLRRALGIPRSVLAERLRVHPTTLLAAERGEVDGTITLNQLRRIAAALDCELTYVLVPRQRPSDVLEQKAEEVALAETGRLFHTMELEKQSPAAAARRRLLADHKAKLLESPRMLWRSR